MSFLIDGPFSPIAMLLTGVVMGLLLAWKDDVRRNGDLWPSETEAMLMLVALNGVFFAGAASLFFGLPWDWLAPPVGFLIGSQTRRHLTRKELPPRRKARVDAGRPHPIPASQDGLVRALEGYPRIEGST